MTSLQTSQNTEGGSQKQDNFLTIQEMVEQCENSTEIRYSDKVAWFSVAGYCTFYNSDEERKIFYLACKDCKKKVTDQDSGYFCESCQKNFGEAVPTFNFSFMFSDCSSKITI
jgi:hypothetical protein